ncbi:MAG: hypothetical protein Q7S12_00630 [bacterium]|nr:hypothetical protein [bacterium]
MRQKLVDNKYKLLFILFSGLILFSPDFQSLQADATQLASTSVTVTAAPSAGNGNTGGGGGGGGGGVTVLPEATKVVIQGKAYPTASIAVLKDGTVATIIQADSLANFKVELANITAGVWTFGLWAEDKAGRKSITFSFTVTVVKDMTTTIAGIFLPPTIELEKTNLAKGESLKILGQTAPQSELSIHIESAQEVVKTTKAGTDGNWNYLFNTNVLEEGAHTTRAKAEDPTGLLSSFSKTLSFYVGKYGTTEISAKADFNKDGKTNLIDFSMLLYWWEKYNPGVDQNRDGKIDLKDFSILMYYWTG